MHSPDTQVKSALNGRGEFDGSTIALLFVVFIVIALIPIVTHTVPPLADYINHLGRTYVINHIGSDPDYARFYTIEWQVLPNLMIDIAMMALNPFMDVYRAGQVFTIIMFVLIVSGTLALNRALFGYWSVVPLVSAPLLYNGVLLVGVMNYVFGIGLTLWALAAWVALREHSWPWRLSVSALFAVALFVCHLFAVGVYGLVLLAFESERLWAKRAEPLWPRLIDFIAAGLPFLLVIALLGMSSTWGSVGEYYWTLSGKIDGLMLALTMYYDSVAFVLIAITLAGAAWATRHRMLHFHPVGWLVLAWGAVVYLAMPRELFAAYLADQRLPIALAFVLIACIQVELRSRRVRQGLVAMLAVLLAVRVVEVQVVWDRLGLVTAELYQAAKLIDRGARVMVVFGDRSAFDEINDFEIVHGASFATIERSALVSSTFTVKGKQVLQVREKFKRYVDTENRWPPLISNFLQATNADVPFYYARWPLHFDFVYILFTKHGAANPDPKDMMRIFDGSRFQLYRVTKPG